MLVSFAQLHPARPVMIRGRWPLACCHQKITNTGMLPSEDSGSESRAGLWKSRAPVLMTCWPNGKASVWLRNTLLLSALMLVSFAQLHPARPVMMRGRWPLTCCLQKIPDPNPGQVCRRAMVPVLMICWPNGKASDYGIHFYFWVWRMPPSFSY